jgi:hypothetical protein
VQRRTSEWYLSHEQGGVNENVKVPTMGWLKIKIDLTKGVFREI